MLESEVEGRTTISSRSLGKLWFFGMVAVSCFRSLTLSTALASNEALSICGDDEKKNTHNRELELRNDCDIGHFEFLELYFFFIDEFLFFFRNFEKFCI